MEQTNTQTLIRRHVNSGWPEVAILAAIAPKLDTPLLDRKLPLHTLSPRTDTKME